MGRYISEIVFGGKMNKLDKLGTKALIRLWIEVENRKQLTYFNSLNKNRGH